MTPSAHAACRLAACSSRIPLARRGPKPCAAPEVSTRAPAAAVPLGRTLRYSAPPAHRPLAAGPLAPRKSKINIQFRKTARLALIGAGSPWRCLRHRPRRGPPKSWCLCHCFFSLDCSVGVGRPGPRSALVAGLRGASRRSAAGTEPALRRGARQSGSPREVSPAAGLRRGLARGAAAGRAPAFLLGRRLRCALPLSVDVVLLLLRPALLLLARQLVGAPVVVVLALVPGAPAALGAPSAHWRRLGCLERLLLLLQQSLRQRRRLRAGFLLGLLAGPALRLRAGHLFQLLLTGPALRLLAGEAGPLGLVRRRLLGEQPGLAHVPVPDRSRDRGQQNHRRQDPSDGRAAREHGGPPQAGGVRARTAGVERAGGRQHRVLGGVVHERGLGRVLRSLGAARRRGRLGRQHGAPGALPEKHDVAAWQMHGLERHRARAAVEVRRCRSSGGQQAERSGGLQAEREVAARAKGRGHLSRQAPGRKARGGKEGYASRL
mmetsp:Transcript_49743/g.133765  ORF Transcript_49743/g.133765 Transcript_49743/m.133765 type:complete len:491 (+) Transcript_49743:176-1648(+)